MKCGEESEPPFVEESRAVKKRKIDAKLTTQVYVMRLKYMVQAMDGNCTVCMVNNLDVSKGYDHMANYCPHLDFYVFLKWKKNIHRLMDLFVHASTSLRLTTAYINGSHRASPLLVSALIQIGPYL